VLAVLGAVGLAVCVVLVVRTSRPIVEPAPESGADG
jgi:hypothetical protein